MKKFILLCCLCVCSMVICAQGMSSPDTETAYELVGKQKFGKAFTIMEKEALRGVAKAQFGLGLMYADGLGVTQNTGRAVEWLEKAANSDFSEAQTVLGRWYYAGQVVPQD